jgi:hypothetical protein
MISELKKLKTVSFQYSHKKLLITETQRLCLLKCEVLVREKRLGDTRFQEQVREMLSKCFSVEEIY